MWENQSCHSKLARWLSGQPEGSLAWEPQQKGLGRTYMKSSPQFHVLHAFEDRFMKTSTCMQCSMCKRGSILQVIGAIENVGDEDNL